MNFAGFSGNSNSFYSDEQQFSLLYNFSETKSIGIISFSKSGF